MLSKEEKLKYGELLRQQIKEKEDAKRMQRREHTPMQEPIIPQQQYPKPVVAIQPQEIDPGKFKSDRQIQKQLLARKMENPGYNPFGKIGSGAPNKQIVGMEIANREGLNQPKQTEKGQYGPQQVIGQPLYNQQRLIRIPTPQFMQGAYDNAQFVHPYYASPAPYGYINTTDRQIDYLGKINLPQRQPIAYQLQQMRPQQKFQLPLNLPPLEDFNQRQQQPNIIPQQNSIQNSVRILQENQLFRKGGRNLLKLENQTTQQMVAKQNQKLRLQQQLKKQIEEAARRKKEEQQRRREEDQRLQQKNKEFIQQEKRKYQEQLNAKKGFAKGVEKANQAANNQPQNLKKAKYQKIRQEVKKREEQERERKELQIQKENAHKKNIQNMNLANKRQNDIDEVASAISNQTQMSRGFNTAISKQFFKKEREKSGKDKRGDKIDKVAEQLQKMRMAINNQGQYFQKEVNKVKAQKQKAVTEVNRLQREIKQKMDAHNRRFLGDLYKGKVQIKDPYYADEVRLEQNTNNLKPKNNGLIVSDFRPESYRRQKIQNQPIMGNESDVMSLNGESKKIPVNIDANESLSISKLDRFAVDTDYFHNKGEPKGKKYNPQESIIEQDQRVEQSRQEKRGRRNSEPKQALDRLIESRKKSRGGWGELSSVNDSIVNQIQNMLQNKARPRSTLSKLGQNSLQSYQRRQTGIKEQQTINSLDKLIQKYTRVNQIES